MTEELSTDAVLVLHPRTEVAVAEYIARPHLPVLIVGPAGSGKASLAARIARELLTQGATEHAAARLAYLHSVRPEDGKAIPVEAVRELQHLLTLSLPAKDMRQIKRVIVIEDAHRMTLEAQNALLKTLEEPPVGTAMLLTAPTADAMLPTVQSRVQQLVVLPPAAEALEAHLMARGFDKQAIGKAMLLSGELPGLATAVLTDDESHPLLQATLHARGILQSTTYERLLLVDGLSKQKDLCLDVLFVLTQMSRVSLLRATSVSAGDKWRRILSASHEATGQLRHNAQAKLVLTNLMLAF